MSEHALDRANPAAGRPVRLYTPPASLGGRLWSWRYLILRRVCQLGVLLMFFGTAHWGWSVAGAPLLTGNLSASEFAGLIPMTDPFAALQILLTRHMLATEALLGVGIVLAFYALVGGRVFCAWVCPVNMVTDLAGWLQARLGFANVLHLNRNLRYYGLALALVLSALTGLAAFEWVSPIAMLHRELIFGVGMGLTGVAGIFLFDLLVLKHGWCGHLCPLGAFYALLGRTAQLRVRFDARTCTRCGECIRFCPEPQVLKLDQAAAAGMVASGECTNCLRCVPICPEGSLSFDLRALIPRHNAQPLKPD
ncbi:MAG: quinol dehydrogenase ferredoxin subunit NapH [Thiobacillaceae bacterium]|nr:quinol dehydrogenase ferredoxin subunit NapH [Thiobacillaceae bacterium]